MKPTEIDEDVYNWLARKGLFGTRAGIKATGEHLASQYSDMQTAAADLDRQKFKKRLAQAIETGLSGNLIRPPTPSASAPAPASSPTTVTPQANVQQPAAQPQAQPQAQAAAPVPESNYFTQMNMIVESIILNESDTLQQFLHKYVNSLVERLNVSPTQRTEIDKLVNDIAGKYQRGQPLPDSVDKLYDAIYAIKALNSSDHYPPPDQDRTLETSSARYTYTSSSDKWYKTHTITGANTLRPVVTPITPEEITNPRQIEQLNKKAQEV